MIANKLIGILLLVIMVHLNMAEEKTDSKPLANVQKSVPGASRMKRDLHYKTILNVALFPFIPDLDGDNHKGLLRYIKEEYEKLYPEIHVIFRPMNTSDRFYDPTVMTKWLAGPGDVYDVVEIDTVILGDLVDAGVVAPYYLTSKTTPADWHQAAVGGVTVNGEIYAYPHLICAILLFTRDVNIASAVTIYDLLRALNSTPATTSYKLIGNLKSSWDATAIYLDGYREANPPYTDLYGNMEVFTGESLRTLRRIAQQCRTGYNTDSCVNGYFDDNYDYPAAFFAGRQAQAMYGYSERLHTILKIAAINNFPNNQDTKIKPIPLGDIQNEPLFFTDAFVFRKGMSMDKYLAARNFVEFMATPKMQAAVAGAEETAKNPTPSRYLLPMSSKAYNIQPLHKDYFYQTYFRNLTGHNLPNRGMNKLRKLGETFLGSYLNVPQY